MMLIAADARMRAFRDLFRGERDEWIHHAINACETPAELREVKHEICDMLGVTPQWLNKLLRGEAYRRKDD